MKNTLEIYFKEAKGGQKAGRAIISGGWRGPALGKGGLWETGRGAASWHHPARLAGGCRCRRGPWGPCVAAGPSSRFGAQPHYCAEQSLIYASPLWGQGCTRVSGAPLAVGSLVPAPRDPEGMGKGGYEGSRPGLQRDVGPCCSGGGLASQDGAASASTPLLLCQAPMAWQNPGATSLPICTPCPVLPPTGLPLFVYTAASLPAAHGVPPGETPPCTPDPQCPGSWLGPQSTRRAGSTCVILTCHQEEDMGLCSQALKG